MKKLPTKILIRHIPPKLTADKFKEMISPIPDYDYFRFCAPDSTLGPEAFCHAYINFIDPQSVFNFRERFSDYVFVDDEGTEANAIVEFATFQGVPGTAPKRMDKRQGTIDGDTEYKAFLASLASSNAPVTAEQTGTVPVSSGKDSDKKQTPIEAMLEILKQREEGSTPAVITPLVAHMNQLLERRKRPTGDELSKSGGSGGKKSGFRNASGRVRSGTARGGGGGGASYNESRASPLANASTRKSSPSHKTSDPAGKQSTKLSGEKLAGEKSARRLARKSRRGQLAHGSQGGDGSQQHQQQSAPPGDLSAAQTASGSTDPHPTTALSGIRSQRDGDGGTSGIEKSRRGGAIGDINDNRGDQQKEEHGGSGGNVGDVSRRARLTSSRGRRGAAGLVPRYPQTGPSGGEQKSQPTTPSYSSRHAAAEKQHVYPDNEEGSSGNAGPPGGVGRGSSGGSGPTRGYRRGKSFSASGSNPRRGVSRGGYR